MNITTRPAIAQIEASFERSGATVPAPLADALARRTEIVDRFATRPIPSVDALPVAVLAALENGTDPATDPDVQRVTASQDLAGRHNLSADIESILLDGIREAASTSAPAIQASWANVFDKAAVALADAYKVLGPVDLDDTAAVVKAGTAATASWAKARDAIAITEAITAGWLGLHQLLTNAVPSKPRRLLMLADIDAETWIDDSLDHAPANAWFALTHGYPLVICPVHDFAARVAEVDQEQRSRADATSRRDNDTANGRRIAI